eukprot:scaffold6021_cov117-Isochrysis_galbana.AAC.2
MAVTVTTPASTPGPCGDCACRNGRDSAANASRGRRRRPGGSPHLEKTSGGAYGAFAARVRCLGVTPLCSGRSRTASSTARGGRTRKERWRSLPAALGGKGSTRKKRGAAERPCGTLTLGAPPPTGGRALRP